MKIRINVGERIAGPLGVAIGGDTVDWPDDIAGALVDAELAVALDPVIEERVVVTPERAVSRKRGKRSKR